MLLLIANRPGRVAHKQRNLFARSNPGVFKLPCSLQPVHRPMNPQAEIGGAAASLIAVALLESVIIHGSVYPFIQSWFSVSILHIFPNQLQRFFHMLNPVAATLKAINRKIIPKRPDGVIPRKRFIP